MQIPATTLTLMKTTTSGIPGRQTNTTVLEKVVIGSLSPLSREDWIQRYSEGSYKDNASYVLHTQETLKVGNELHHEGKKFKVIGFFRGRIRNTAHLQEV